MRIAGYGYSSSGSASLATRTCTSLPTKTRAFASTVDRRDATVPSAAAATDSVRMPATRKSDVSAGAARSRRTASQAALTPDPPAREATRSSDRATRAHRMPAPSASASGNRKTAGPGRATPAASITPPRSSSPASTQATAKAASSQGIAASTFVTRWRCSCLATNAAPDTTATIATEPTTPARAATAAVERVPADTGASGPTEETSIDADAHPASPPRAAGSIVSSPAFAPNANGLHPRIVSTPSSTRRPAAEKMPAAATTAREIASPATRSTTMGSRTAVMRCRTSCTTRLAFCVIVTSLAPRRVNVRPQHRRVPYRSPPGLDRSRKLRVKSARSEACASVSGGSTPAGACHAKVARGNPSAAESSSICSGSARMNCGGAEHLTPGHG